MRGVVVGLLVAGCTPGSGDGLGELGERAFRDHAVAVLSSTAVADGFEIHTDDPDVIRLVSNEELGDDELVPKDAWFETGAPGYALLTLVDPLTGEELDAVEVEVAEPHAMALAPAGPWRWADPMEPRILAGVDYTFRPVALDRAGRPLEGFDPDEDCVEVPASPPGERTFHGVTVSFVDPADLVAIDLEPTVGAEGIAALVAVGRDREGRGVLGLPAAWTEVDAPGDRGDLFAFLPAADASLVEVTASYGDLVGSALVSTDAPGTVGHSDRALGCSSTGSASGALLAGVALLAQRRRSRATAIGSTTLLPHSRAAASARPDPASRRSRNQP